MTMKIENFDPQSIAFIKEKIDAFIKWDVIYLLYTNPHLMDTAEQIAYYIGRHPQLTELALTMLTQDGLVIGEKNGQVITYRLTNDEKVLKQLKQFLTTRESQRKQRMLMYHLIQELHGHQIKANIQAIKALFEPPHNRTSSARCKPQASKRQ